MYETLTVPPTRPAPPPMPEVHVQPPVVYVEPVWEYKVRKATQGASPDEAELNALGAQGWELVGVATEGTALHFYFKRLVR